MTAEPPLRRRFQTMIWKAPVLVLIASLWPPGVAAAWSRTGHMTIAAMAYRQLPGPLQRVYTDLLRHHPEFENWQAAYEELDVSLDFGEFLFMEASFWPDQIRRAGNDYDHPTWHYTNFPLIPDAFPLNETMTPENDVLFGIAESRRIVADTSAAPVERAAHLSWILHLVGDLHQPLHSVALVNEIYPEGDRGGNNVFVRAAADRRPINLHAFWDGLLGTRHDVRDARNEATRLLEIGENTQVQSGSEVRSWVLESREQAIQYVYLRGELRGETGENREAAPVLPADYARQAKSTAERQAIRAGFRMARLLIDP